MMIGHPAQHEHANVEDQSSFLNFSIVFYVVLALDFVNDVPDHAIPSLQLPHAEHAIQSSVFSYKYEKSKRAVKPFLKMQFLCHHRSWLLGWDGYNFGSRCG